MTNSVFTPAVSDTFSVSALPSMADIVRSVETAQLAHDNSRRAHAVELKRARLSLRLTYVTFVIAGCATVALGQALVFGHWL